MVESTPGARRAFIPSPASTSCYRQQDVFGADIVVADIAQLADEATSVLALQWQAYGLGFAAVRPARVMDRA
jgi:hypothetical protein